MQTYPLELRATGIVIELLLLLLLLKVKVKQYRNRSGVAQRIPRGLGSQIFMTFGT
jgi:hypothetical protein